MALQKPDGDIRPILCGEVWRRCFASVVVNATPIRNGKKKNKLQVFGMAPRIARRYYQYSMITLTLRTRMTLM